MAKQLNVNLAFTADTGKAKAQLQDLQRQLDNLIKGSPSATNFAITDKLVEAQGAAAALKVALDQSMNVQTGKLDLTRFNDSIKKSGLSLKELKTNLELLGPTGSQTFMSLSKSILSAEVPIRRTNALLSEMWVTMKNTARWQLSSSILHSFMGTIQSAYGYAKDLDQSLNNIRIVTGQNTEEMAKFAEQANKAAKILSTTTTNYTNASLIYYQQGLSDQEVLERTNTTIKMANVAGQTAEVVSDQMTAVWNNFDDGSKSLEYYADVMTKLGATTASSTAEIAEGLEKFAAVSETVGLSYEYATSALATVTATTRQSADVVGTAFKTLFARIQGLNLGETLDDGTTLNKYSEALNKVGISIFDQHGEMKAMDDILDEMGAKWGTLNKDQQTALAQTVAGVRQYTQLMALMENWDFFQENLEAAYNATGALEEQADIYAESWKAARDRIKASMEDIYDSVLDEKFFIGLLNGFDDVLGIVGDLTDSLNGLPGVISMIGVVLTKAFTPQLTQTVDNMLYGLSSLTGANAMTAKATKDQAYNLASNMGYDDGTREGEAISAGLKTQLDLQKQLIDNEKNLSAEEIKRLQTLMDINQQYADAAIQAAKAEDAARTAVGDASRDIRSKVVRSVGSDQTRRNQAAHYYQENRAAMQQEIATGAKYQNQLTNVAKNLNEKNVQTYNNALTSLRNNLTEIGQLDTSSKIENLQIQFQNDKDVNKFRQGLDDLVKSGAIVDDTVITASDNFRALYPNVNLSAKEVDNLANKDMALAQATIQSNTTMSAQEQQAQKVAQAINAAKVAADSLAASIVKLASGTSQILMGFNALKSVVDTLNNDDLSFGEKLSSVMMSLSMGLPMLINGFKTLTAVKYADMAANAKDVILNGAVALSHSKVAVALGAEKHMLKEVAIAGKTAEISIAGLLATTGVFIAVAAGIAAIAYGLTVAADAYNADANAAKRASEAADNLAESASQVKQEFADLQNSISAYDSAIETLENCKTGTDEWREALENVNDEIWSILEKYPELAKMDGLFKEDGTLNKEVVNTYVNQQENRVDQARAAALSASGRAEKLKVVADTTDLARSIASMSQQYIVDDTALAANESIAKTFTKNILELAQNPETSYEELNDAIDSQVSSFGLYGNVQDSLADQIKDNVDEFRELAKAANAANTQMENLGKLIGGEVLGLSATEEQLDEFGEKYSTNEELKYNELYNSLTGAGINQLSNKNNEIVQDVWSRYQAATGTNFTLDRNAVIGNDQNRYLQYLNEDGETVKISAEEIAAAIAAAEATSLTEEEMRQAIVNAFQNEDGKSVVNENISTELINTLKQQIDMSNADTLSAVTNLLDQYKDDADAQRKIIEEILNSKTDEQQASELAGNAANQYGFDKELIEEQADQLQKIYEAEKLTEVEATKLAIENQRMNKGVEDLIDNWEDWNKELKAGKLDKEKKGTVQYAKTIKDLTKTIADLTGASQDLELPDEFFDSEDNLKLIEQAAQGSESAINALGIAVAKTGIEMAKQNDWYVTFADGSTELIFASEFETAKQTVLAGLDELQTKLAEGQSLVGQGLQDILSSGAEGANGWIQALNDMALATGMSVEEMNSMLNSLGLEADVTVTEVETKSRKPITKTRITNPIYDDNGNLMEYDTQTFVSGYDYVPEVIQVAQIATNGQTAESPAVKFIGNGSISPTSSATKGGGSNKPTKVDKTKKSDVVDRYKEVNDQIDDLEESLDDASKAADRLFGADRVKALEKERNLLKQQIPLLEKKRDEAKSYLAVDKQLLMDTGKKYGITFETDGVGNITNYTAELTKLYNELAAAEEKMNNMSTKDAQDKYKESTLDPLNEKINELKDAISQYDETRELLEDLEDEITDAFNAWQDKNYEILTYKLEIELELNDAELQEIEFELSLIEDDFYKMAEAAVLMKNQIDPLNDSLSDLDNHFENLTDAYEDGKISQADYIDGLKETRDSIYDQLNALVDLDKEMMEYYGNTLDAAMEELDKYTDHMEHLTGVINHYISLMELMGKSTDFEAMDEFLSARAETTKNELDVAKSNYEMLARQKAQIEERMAGTEEGSADWKLYKEEWDKIVATMDEAQDEMLSKTEEWMEAMKAVIENNMNKAAKSLEDALTNSMSFDHMMTELDRLNERQEEYLTKTNQVYETNKLMRAAAQAADKTDNAVAKQKFKNFAEETKQLQEKGQLSKYELEIQQAKYDLLLAEIALEDAQNAKSTVRLQRDSEGNFGYVYTADQDKISDAQQAVEDAENDLYNISLNGQQEYTEKYTQALQSMYDEMKALQEAYLNGDIATEQEYQTRKEALMQHYFGVPDGILTTYSSLYNVAVQTDANATADFWAKSYGDMTANTEEFKTAVNGYLVEVETETEAWHDITKAAQEDITEGLDDLIDESEEYADVVDDEVIPALEDELDAVEDLTAGYADQRAEVLRLIQTYKQLVQAINAAIAAAARQSGSSRNGSGDLSLDAANAFVAGEDTSGILTERGEKMANGNHPVATDNDTLVNLFKDAEKNPGGEADKIIQDVAAGNSKFHDHKLDKWSFDTGGYTGEWGPQAKLAFVHEKEIMLNPDDTVNFLSAIQITRSIMELIDKQAGWASAGLGIMSAYGVQDYNQVLEQEVTIHAEFPNATNHNEIEEAFNNLMNTASQYANRKNR